MTKGLHRMKMLRSESGIAMVVVLLVAAALTVVSSTAAYVTIREFGANADDRRGAQALAYAESALDRTVASIEGGVWGWKSLVSSGCDDATLTARNLDPDQFPLVVGADLAADGRSLAPGTGGDIGIGGMYRAVLDICLGSGADFPRPRDEHEGTIRAIGEHPTARREVLQDVLLEPKGLPVGIYASAFVNINGSGSLQRVSLVSPGPITGRDQIAMVGMDPYYERSDFYPCEAPNTPTNCFPEDGDDAGDMPASVHSGDLITCQSNCPRSSNSQPLSPREHPSSPTRSPNCDANRSAGTALQSMWDGDNWTNDDALAAIGSNVCGWVPDGTMTGQQFPPTSRFDEQDARRLAPSPQMSEADLSALRSQAQTNGIYCGVELSGSFDCFKQGVLRNAIETNPGAKVQGSLEGAGTGDLAGLPKTFVAYFDFPVGATNNTLDWRGDMSFGGQRACQEPPNHMSVTIIVRNGNFDGGGSVFVNGTVIANEGEIDLDGGYTINGTVIARSVEIISGADITLDDCWVDNMQTSRIEVTPTSWSEIDR